MGKRKESGFDVLSSMPWPVCLAWGLLGFIAIRYGIGWLWGSSGNVVLAGFANAASMGAFAPIAWVALLFCCIAALASFVRRQKRRRLLDSQTGMDSLRDMDWRAFERLVGEAFRRQGYGVEETGQGGADGGIDLILRKRGETTLVQCKQWRTYSVSVKVVREMYGILMDKGAAAVKIVALGGYAPDAAAFARGKPIELVDGNQLLATVTNIQARREPDGALDRPWSLAGGVLACLLIALALPTKPSRRPTPPSEPPVPTFSPVQRTVAAPAAPAIQPISARAGATAPPSPKAYKADPPMTNEELRDWEKRHREAMRILEKTTPELETAPAH